MGDVVTINQQDVFVSGDHFSEQKNRDWLLGLLKDGEVEVTFIKRGGDKRVMDCSLDPAFIPVTEKKTDRVKKENPDVVSVVDVEIGEWRSFRWDSIVNIKWGVPTNEG